MKTDSFTEQPTERIPKATEITNVYAVLKGTDAASAKRIVLVTGHYDSRNSNILDATGEAPGANDDASGTAVSLECARVLSKMKISGNNYFSDRGRRRARPERQPPFRKNGQRPGMGSRGCP